MKVYLFTYNRPKMLKATLKHLKSHGIEPTVYNDGVDFPHRGKEGFWQTWDECLKDASKVKNEDLFLFMPDDFENIDIERIKQIHESFKGKPYVYNIINDGRHESWVIFKKQKPINGTERVGFTDCGFFCNRRALEATLWKVKPIPKERWIKNPLASSGVGRYLTIMFTNRKIPMYKPEKSLAYHGDHESQMHKEERKINPLISK